jgi:hypothetical protein
MNDQPPPIDVALSIRQPWAWLILNGGKDVENRDWVPSNPGLDFRGPFYIHASRALYGTKDDRVRIRAWVFKRFGLVIPADDRLITGGIVGRANVIDVVRESTSPWFEGPYGLVLADAKPVPFVKMTGTSGFFSISARAALNFPEQTNNSESNKQHEHDHSHRPGAIRDRGLR